MKGLKFFLLASTLAVAAMPLASCGGDKVPINNGAGPSPSYDPLSIEDAYRDLDQARAKADELLASDPNFAGSTAAKDVASYLEDAKTHLATASVAQDKADKEDYRQAIGQAHGCITAANDLLAARKSHTLPDAR